MPELFVIKDKEEFNSLNVDKQYTGTPGRFPCIAVRLDPHKPNCCQYVFVYPDQAEELIQATNARRAALRKSVCVGLADALKQFPQCINITPHNQYGIQVKVEGSFTPQQLSSLDLTISDHLNKYDVDIPYVYYFDESDL